MTQLTADLFSITHLKKKDRIEAAKLTAQINVLGLISKLPEAIKEFKSAQDQVERRKQQQYAEAFDPLNKE